MATNGKLASSDLANLSTPGRLLKDAAASFERLRKATGTKGTTASNHAYRTYAEQESIFTARYQRSYAEYAPGKVDARVWNGQTWYRKPGQSAAAVPGTSNHGWGKAVDFQGLGGYGSSTWTAFANIAPWHGWSNTEGKQVDEPWHWVYNKANDKHLTDTEQEDSGVELNEKITLTAWMKNAAGWQDKTAITVEQALGYTAAGTAGLRDGLNLVLAAIDALAANQAALMEAIADLTVDVSVDLKPVVGPFTVALEGTLSQDTDTDT